MEVSMQRRKDMGMKYIIVLGDGMADEPILRKSLMRQ